MFFLCLKILNFLVQLPQDLETSAHTKKEEKKKIFFPMDAPINFLIAIFRMSFLLSHILLNKKFRNTPGAVMQSQSLSENNIDALFSFSLSSASNTLHHLSHVYKFKSIVYIILETQNLFFTYYSIPISIPMPLSRMFSICLCIHSHLLFEVTAEQYSLLGYGYRMDVCARVFLIYMSVCLWLVWRCEL